jgi:hypothetical protein
MIRKTRIKMRKYSLRLSKLNRRLLLNHRKMKKIQNLS